MQVQLNVKFDSYTYISQIILPSLHVISTTGLLKYASLN